MNSRYQAVFYGLLVTFVCNSRILAQHENDLSIPTVVRPVYSANASEFQETVRKKFAQPCELKLEQVTLADAINAIEKAANVPIEINQGALDDLGISEDAEVTWTTSGTSLGYAFTKILQSIQLTYVFEHEYVLITSPTKAERKLETRIYPVQDLLTSPRFVSSSRKRAPDFDTLINVIIATVHPDSWDNVGGNGTIQAVHWNLVISQTNDVHEKVLALLTAMRQRKPLGFEDPARNGKIAIAVAVERTIADDSFFQRATRALENDAEFQSSGMSIGDFAAFVSKTTNLPVVIDGNALDELGLTNDDDVGDHHFSQISVRSMMDLVLSELGLAYSIDDEAIAITSPSAVESRLRLQLYDVTKLLSIDQANSLSDVRVEMERIVDVIVYAVAPDSWEDVGGEGSLQIYPSHGLLVCSNADNVQGQVGALIQQLFQARADHPNLPSAVDSKRSPYVTHVFKYVDEGELDLSGVANLIRTTIAAGTWRQDGDGPMVAHISDRLVVRHEPDVHLDVTDFLLKLGGFQNAAPINGAAHRHGGFF